MYQNVYLSIVFVTANFFLASTASAESSPRVMPATSSSMMPGGGIVSAAVSSISLQMPPRTGSSLNVSQVDLIETLISDCAREFIDQELAIIECGQLIELSISQGLINLLSH